MAKRINQDRSEGVDGNMSEKFLADLRGLVWKHVEKNGRFTALASKANLNEATITRMMWHQGPQSPQTRRPHFETVVRLLWALDRLDLLTPVFKGGQDHKPIKWGKKQAR